MWDRMKGAYVIGEGRHFLIPYLQKVSVFNLEPASRLVHVEVQSKGEMGVVVWIGIAADLESRFGDD